MTEPALRTTTEKLENLLQKLETLSNRDYLGRQRLLMRIQILRGKQKLEQVDEDCPRHEGQ